MKNNIYELPVINNDKEYYIIINENEVKDFITYEIINLNQDNIGQFKVGLFNNMATMTYYINEEYQNQKIGQSGLNFVTKHVFLNYDINRIVIIATNIQSKSIALNNTYEPVKRNILELKKDNYFRKKSF